MSQDRTLSTPATKVMDASTAKRLNRIEGVFIQALQPKIQTHEFLDIQRELDRRAESQRSEKTSNEWQLRKIINDVAPRPGFSKQRPSDLVDALSSEEELYYSLLHYAAMFQCVHAHAGLLSSARIAHYQSRLFCTREALLRQLPLVQTISFADTRLAALYEDLQQCALEALNQLRHDMAEQAQPAERQRSLRMLLSSRWHRLREKSP